MCIHTSSDIIYHSPPTNHSSIKVQYNNRREYFAINCAIWHDDVYIVLTHIFNTVWNHNNDHMSTSQSDKKTWHNTVFPTSSIIGIFGWFCKWSNERTPYERRPWLKWILINWSSKQHIHGGNWVNFDELVFYTFCSFKLKVFVRHLWISTITKTLKKM